MNTQAIFLLCADAAHLVSSRAVGGPSLTSSPKHRVPSASSKAAVPLDANDNLLQVSHLLILIMQFI